MTLVNIPTRLPCYSGTTIGQAGGNVSEISPDAVHSHSSSDDIHFPVKLLSLADASPTLMPHQTGLIEGMNTEVCDSIELFSQ